MARIRFRGLEEYELMLSRLRSRTEEIAGKAIYEGAKIVADAVKENIEALPITRNQRGTPENPIDGITLKQKQGLIDSFGITPMKLEDGVYNVKLGFDGYNDVEGEYWVNGQPNQMIARAVESGTSFRKKHPFVRPAVAATRHQAEAKMAQVIDEEIEKIMK